MKMKSMVLLCLAIGCGLVAMLGVQRAMSGDGGAEEELVVSVLVAKTEINPGVRLEDGVNVTWKDLPASAVPKDAVTKPEEFANRALRMAAITGDTILVPKLGEEGVFSASSEIPEGMRVCSVSVDATKTHSGLIQPGDRVDVLVTYSSRSQRGMAKKTKTVLEYIAVFAADNRRLNAVSDSGEAIQAKNISLLVDPDQAQLLMLAQNKGMLHLAMRNREDATAAKPSQISDDIFDDIETSMGSFDETGEESSDGENQRPMSIEEALKQEMKKQQKPEPEPVAAVEPVAEPAADAKPTWKIDIYAGEEHRVDEVELPETTSTNPETPKVSAS